MDELKKYFRKNIWSVLCTKLELKMKENKFLINLLDENRRNLIFKVLLCKTEEN